MCTFKKPLLLYTIYNLLIFTFSWHNPMVIFKVYYFVTIANLQKKKRKIEKWNGLQLCSSFEKKILEQVLGSTLYH